MASAQYDIFIVGGGINGCGIARDAVGRGYSVALAEMNDLASGTSSWSTKLIHGGLRYLEHYEFRLVRESLMEREVLWAAAPHIIHPMRFVLPHHSGLRPAWLLRLGLFLYDHIGGRRKLPPTKVLDLTRDEAGKPLKPQFKKAFEYSDCWVNDARLVVLNARDAADRGAAIHTRTKVVSAVRRDGVWEVTLDSGGDRRTVTARLLVNAAGPWVDAFLQGALGRNDRNVRLVQGSHIVVNRKFEHDRAYFFQNQDGRIFFAIPYEQDYTLIGTTDRDYSGDPGRVEISQEEIEYLCAGASEYFREPVKPTDIVWTYSGVRPLFDDGASKAQEATRDYVLKTETQNGDAPLVNIFGGKITTYRRLSESVLAEIGRQIGAKGKPWTANAPLPGGDFPVEGFEDLLAGLRRDYPFLPASLSQRLARLYGTRARALLGPARSLADLGRLFGADLYEAEVDYLLREEWARTAEDVLWRRTKRGLRLKKQEVQELEAWMASHRRSAGTEAAE
ncbi:MAG: glycerol-3-phosphate dehydrogenase [Nitratireductor sp.]|nr:glycerol-3-phosphate dehydrogenase [Nitratireductor sp.]